MLTRNYIFSIEDLLIRIKEAESLQVQLMELFNRGDKPLRNAFALRWAVVSDEVTQLMLLAEEQLSKEQLLQVKQMLNNDYPGCWEDYHDNSGRLTRLYAEDDKFM